MSETINGWKPPIIRDADGRTRIATQADVDILVALRFAYAETRRNFEAIEATHDAFRAAELEYNAKRPL